MNNVISSVHLKTDLFIDPIKPVMARPAVKKARILVIDDAQDVLDLLNAILRNHPYEVHTARSGASGWQKIGEISPDLILLDIMMPEQDGFRFAKKILSDPETKTIPIMFLTARSDIKSLQTGLGLGAIEYLVKPFNAAELIARIEVALRIKFLQDDLMRANAELQSMALTDPLTGLRNRRFLSEHLQDLLPVARRYKEPLCCTMVDIDHFKQVNDTYGHPVGDEVLLTLAKLMKSSLREADIVGRYGGEEFIIVSPRTDLKAGHLVTERLRKTVENTTFSTAKGDLSITISVGFAVYDPANPESAYDLIERADTALYAAKNAGRNKVMAAQPVGG